MEALFLYFGKVIVCSGVMFLYYRLSLKDKTFHHYNRFYLLSVMLVSIFLPLIKVEDFTVEVSHNVYLLLDKIQNLKTDKNINHDGIYFRIIFSALGLVSFYFVSKLVYGIFKIQQFKNRFQKESFEGVNFYQTNLSEAPFSYFRNLFWKNTIVINSDIGKQILTHEMVHIEQKHSYDKIFIEIITSVFWFNPFFHIIKKEVSLIHEYLADKKAVKQSDTKAFAQMLLASHFSGKELQATSPFLSSNLKKRLKMLQKPQTKFGYVRRISALPVIFTIAFAYLVNAKNNEITETNIDIENAVSEIKNDTLKPNSLAEIEIKLHQKQAEIDGISRGLAGHEKKIEELNKIIDAKNSILQKLEKEKKFDSEEYGNLMNEVDLLYHETDKIYSSEPYTKIWKEMDEKYSEIDKLYSEMDKIYKVKENERLLETKTLKRSEKRNGKPARPSSKAREKAEAARKNTEEAQRKTQKSQTNEYADFFSNTEKARALAKTAGEHSRKELQKIIIIKNESSSFKNNFKKGRNYDKNPLTKEETEALK